MFRDGIFNSFGDFLDSINESTCKEEKGDILENQIGIGDTVQILDKEGNTTIVPSAQVYDLSTTEPEGSLSVEVTGAKDEDERQWYDEGDYEIVLLKKANESKLPETNRKEDVSVDTVEEEISNFVISDRNREEVDLDNFLESLVDKYGYEKVKSAYELGVKKGTLSQKGLDRLEVMENRIPETNRKVATDTELPDEQPPKDDAEKLSMEDWSDTDKDGKPKRKDKVEYPSKLREPEEREFSSEVKYERKKDPLHLCNECFKTFRSKETICLFCENKNTESIGKVKEDGSDVPFYKNIFAVSYKLNGKDNETKVEAFDEADAKKYVERLYPGSKASSAKKIGESKVKEAYKEQHPGSYTVTFYDGHKEKISYAETQKDAARKAKEIYKKDNRVISAVLDKKSETKGEGSKWTVIFVDGHKEVVETPNKYTAMQKARELYPDEHRISQVNSGVMEKVNETVQELVGETPGINKHEQDILNWAIENNVIPNEWPPLQDMIDDVLDFSDVTDKYSKEDFDGLDLGDIEAVFLKHILLPAAKKSYIEKESSADISGGNPYTKWERPGLDMPKDMSPPEFEFKINDNKIVPKVKMTTGQGTSYYADCPNCGTTNWLSGELKTNSAICKKCGTPFKLGEEVDHEDYMRESKVKEGNWWQQLINDIKKDKKVKALLDKYGVRSKEVSSYFSKKYWGVNEPTNASKTALENVLKELDLSESKVNEQEEEWNQEKIETEIMNPLADGFEKTGKDYWFSGRRINADDSFTFEYLSIHAPYVEVTVFPDRIGSPTSESKINEQDVESLRKRKMDIEQKMLDAEKRYQDEQNRMGSEVDRLNQQIKAKEGSETE